MVESFVFCLSCLMKKLFNIWNVEKRCTFLFTKKEFNVDPGTGENQKSRFQKCNKS